VQGYDPEMAKIVCYWSHSAGQQTIWVAIWADTGNKSRNISLKVQANFLLFIAKYCREGACKFARYLQN